ncbi:MucBP domain-containing protein [Listeria monocytogenes]|nr:MucBP domain-containing protein [Listeria monocytogenes]EKT6045407.1 MucBP domain-containing protein [Listeria monocytogenes]
MKNILVTFFLCLVMLATIFPFDSLEVNAASVSWLEQELDGNEPFILATEDALSKNREDITLADLETIQILETPVVVSSIPDKISDYKNLTELSAIEGTITELPDSIGQLKKLKSLNVNQNNLQEFPTIVLQLPELEYLYINKGNITEIPEEITGLSSHLKELDIRFQQLITLPASIFMTSWGNSLSGELSILTTGNQLVSDIPANYLDNFNNGGNMLEFYNNPPGDYHQHQDQLVYKGGTIEVPLNTDFNQLTPDKSQLGLQSGIALFPQHDFMYDDDGSSNNVLTNGIATSVGSGYITIKSTYSTNSNPFAKVRVPIEVTAPVKGADVMVQYQNSNGTDLATPETLSGNVGDSYTTTAKDIPGWKLKTTPANAIGTFSDKAQTVTYEYEEIVVPAQDVIVKYVDEEGNELASSEMLSGNVGDSYTTTAKDIPGWKLKTTPANATGTFSDKAQTVTYVYEVVSDGQGTLPVIPNFPGINNDKAPDNTLPSNTMLLIQKNITISSGEKAFTLPKTGDNTQGSSMLIGGGLLLCGAALLSRRQTNNK